MIVITHSNDFTKEINFVIKLQGVYNIPINLLISEGQRLYILQCKDDPFDQ